MEQISATEDLSGANAAARLQTDDAESLLAALHLTTIEVIALDAGVLEDRIDGHGARLLGTGVAFLIDVHDVRVIGLTIVSVATLCAYLGNQRLVEPEGWEERGEVDVHAPLTSTLFNPHIPTLIKNQSVTIF